LIHQYNQVAIKQQFTYAIREFYYAKFGKSSPKQPQVVYAFDVQIA